MCNCSCEGNKYGKCCRSPWLRAIQIFLLLLIALGLGLLVTQHLWVPKLVNFILSQEGILL